jgi:hypothetical protein
VADYLLPKASQRSKYSGERVEKSWSSMDAGEHGKALVGGLRHLIWQF